MDTIPYAGVSVVARDGAYAWRCYRPGCRRHGLLRPTYLEANAGRTRHEAMHDAQDRVAAAQRRRDPSCDQVGAS